MFLIWHVGLLINLVTKDKAKSSIKYMIKIKDDEKSISNLIGRSNRSMCRWL